MNKRFDRAETLSIDDARLRPHLRHRERTEARHNDRKRMLEQQADILLSAAADNKRRGTRPGASGGDPRDLRGIPVIAQGVGGTSPHTQPEASTVAKLSREKRAA